MSCKVAVLGAAGGQWSCSAYSIVLNSDSAAGIGQPLSLLLKQNQQITDLALFDVVPVVKGVAVDLRCTLKLCSLGLALNISLQPYCHSKQRVRIHQRRRRPRESAQGGSHGRHPSWCSSQGNSIISHTRSLLIHYVFSLA